MTVKSEAQQLSSGLESSFGVAATTGWRKRRYLPGGLKGFVGLRKKVADNSVSANRQLEKGNVVDHDFKPSINALACKDLFDDFTSPSMLAVTKFIGGGKLWFPTAVTSAHFTVDALGAILQGLLVKARGFANAANNGVFLVGASSIAENIIVTGTVAETVSPAGSAELEVCGFQGASSDITMDVSGNLLSTTLDFTTIVGLMAGETIRIGSFGDGAAFAFTSVPLATGRILSVAAHQITMDPTTLDFTPGVDAGAGKTIRVLIGSFDRNVPITSADYIEPSVSLDLSQPGSGAAGVTEWVSGYGGTVDMLEIDAPLADQLKVTITMIGTRCDDPRTSQLAGPAAAFPSVAFAPFNTVGDLKIAQLRDLTGADVVTKVNNFKLTFKNNVTGIKFQGTEGVGEMAAGMAENTVALTAYLAPGGAQAAIGANTTLQFRRGFANGDMGIVFDCPELTLSGGDPAAAANGPVTLPLTLGMNRSAKFGYTLGITRFPHWPPT